MNLLEEHIRSMSDQELRDAYEMIRGNPKRSPRRMFSEAELQALRDLSDEMARRNGNALAAPQKPQPVESLLDDDDYAVLEMDNAPQEPRDCEHDYVFSAENEYRCDKCGQISKDGVYPRVGPYPQEPQP